MSESHDSRPQTRVRSGAHRAQRSSVVAALLPSVLAVAAVAALITSLVVWQGEESAATRAAAAESTQTASGKERGETDREASAAPETTSAAPSPAAASPSPETSSAAPSETAATEKAATEKAEPAREMTVVVLNQTTRRGLAARIAGELRAQGWAVSGVGNFIGVVPATTVYYPPGGGEQALVLARDLPTEPRTRPRFGNLSTSSLTIVVTNSYPG